MATNPNPNNEDSPPQYTGHPFFDFFQQQPMHDGAGVDYRGGPHFGGGFPFAGGFPFGGPTVAGRGCPGRMRSGRCRRGDRRGWWDEMQEGSASDEPSGTAGEQQHREKKTGAQGGEKNDEGVAEADGSPDTMREVDDPPEETPHAEEGRGCGRGPGRHSHGHGHGHGGHPHRRGGRGWRGGFWGPGGLPFGPHAHGPHGPNGPHHAPPHPPQFPSFDAQTIQAMVEPYAEMARTWAEQFRQRATAGVDTRNTAAANNSNNNNGNDGSLSSDSFEPPVDVFDTEHAFVLHVALPGAKKEDVGVNWDGDKGELSIAGVVHRPGDEAFLQTMVSTERRAGLFERLVRIPPQGREKDEVDGLAISAKLEDGILVVTVPKLEKEWTEIRKVDIE